jgi:hypothetical protein
MMSIYRLYTGDDGQSHIEEQHPSSHPALTTRQATQPIFFRERPRGLFSEWHNAPRRQYLIILSGEVEIGLGDGTKHRFGAGTALLAEDTSGQGHKTLIVDGEPVIQAVIPLADEA